MNTLRAVTWGGGGLVVLSAVWATLHYGGPARFLPTAAIGVVAATLPFGIAYSKSAVRSLRRRFADVDAGLSAEKGSIFVSQTTVDDPVDCLEAIVAAVRSDDDYDDVERESFDEGPGLMVMYTGFHNSFVRITEAGRVVVTGTSEHTHDLAATVGEAYALSFDRTRNNPFSGMEPIRGAPRVFLGVFIVVMLLVGVGTIGATAYPSDAYNPAERTVIVGLDARGDLDPGTGPTETRLAKAAFLVAIVDEEAQEIRWVQNESDRVTEHGRQALRVSRDADALLTAARDDSPTPAQAERTARLERRLVAARTAVATTMTERVESGSVNETVEMRRVVERLRAPGDRDGDRAATDAGPA
jgi:hypothetical protein